MTEPAIDLNASETLTPTTYDIPIITGGSVVGAKVIRWGNADSADGAITNVTLPASGDAWAPELWIEDTGAADDLCCDVDEQPEAGTQRPMQFELTSDDVAFATLPRITVYDDTGHTEAEEFIVGIASHTSPYIKARGQTVNTAPEQYWGESTNQDLHDLQSAGAVTCGNATGSEENCGLEGDTSYLESSALNIFTTPQFFSLALSATELATTGVDTINGVLSVRYTYT